MQVFINATGRVYATHACSLTPTILPRCHLLVKRQDLDVPYNFLSMFPSAELCIMAGSLSLDAFFAGRHAVRRSLTLIPPCPPVDCSLGQLCLGEFTRADYTRREHARHTVLDFKLFDRVWFWFHCLQV